MALHWWKKQQKIEHRSALLTLTAVFSPAAISWGPKPPPLYMSVCALHTCLSLYPSERSNQSSVLFFFCLQLMGFIYACYVVKLISEEEDSCKYTAAHISMQTSHFFCNKAVCSCVSVCRAALGHLFSFTGSAVLTELWKGCSPYIYSFIIAAAWGPMSCCGGSKMWSKQSGILLVWIASWFNSAAQVNPARGSLTTWCVSKRSTRRWALRLKTGRFVFNGRHAVLMLIGWLYF